MCSVRAGWVCGQTSSGPGVLLMHFKNHTDYHVATGVDDVGEVDVHAGWVGVIRHAAKLFCLCKKLIRFCKCVENPRAGRPRNRSDLAANKVGILIMQNSSIMNRLTGANLSKLVKFVGVH